MVSLWHIVFTRATRHHLIKHNTFVTSLYVIHTVIHTWYNCHYAVWQSFSRYLNVGAASLHPYKLCTS